MLSVSSVLRCASRRSAICWLWRVRSWAMVDIPRTVPSESTQLQYLAEPLPHDARWQTGVAEAILDGSQYETDFVRGVYERFLTYTLCTTVSSVGGGGTKDPGFLKQVPGGWVGVGLIAVVVLLGAAAAVFFTIERRRFARTYPDEIPRHGA